jgi:hypothetical protein
MEKACEKFPLKRRMLASCISHDRRHGCRSQNSEILPQADLWGAHGAR